MDRVRLAIVGCGNISQLNAPGYLQHPRCDVVALCDADPERAKRRARDWGITPRIYSDFAQVLDDSTVDAVELLTPTWMHADQIVAALGAGKHVSAQKPLAVSHGRGRSHRRRRGPCTDGLPRHRELPLLPADPESQGAARRRRHRRADAGAHPHHAGPEHRGWRHGARARRPRLAARSGPQSRRRPLRRRRAQVRDGRRCWIGEIGEISAIVTRRDDFLQETPSVATFRFKGRDCLGIIDYTYAPEMTIRSRYYKADEFFEIHGTRGTIWVTRCTGEMLDMPAVILLRGTETIHYQVPDRLAPGLRRRGRGLRGRPAGRAPARSGHPRGAAHAADTSRHLRGRPHRRPRGARVDQVAG